MRASHPRLAWSTRLTCRPAAHRRRSPEAIFDIDYLVERPEAFYTLASELYPGNFKPTTSHYFFRLLQDKGLLHGCWCATCPP